MAIKNKKKNHTSSAQKPAETTGNVYRMVTARILEAMEKGELPWRTTHVRRKGDKPPYVNFVTGKPYSFLNGLLLGEPGEYLSFKQVKARGGVVKKGAKAKMVIYWGDFIPEKDKELAEQLQAEGKSIDHLKIPFPKYYLVFNIKDTEGVRPMKQDEEIPEMEEAENPTAVAKMVIGDYEINKQAKVEEGVVFEPRYDITADKVEVPLRTNYSLEEDWYASVFGCLVHSTALEERCNRSNEMKKMLEGEISVKEELIAEIGSSMILSACGLKRKETHEQIDAECQKWMKVMNKDYRILLTSANAAEKAAKYVLGEFAA